MQNGAAPIDAALQRGNQPNPRRAPIRPDTRTIKVPLDLSPGSIVGESSSAASGRLAMESIHNALVHIRDAAADPSVELPRLATAASSAMKGALSSADKALGNIQSHMAALDRDISQAIMPLSRNPVLDQEIRAHVKAEHDLSKLAKAVEADARVSSAVLSAPAFLSGLSDEQREVIRATAVEAHAADKAAELEEAGQAMTRLANAAKRMKEIVEPRVARWSQPDNEDLKSLESASRSAFS